MNILSDSGSAYQAVLKAGITEKGSVQQAVELFLDAITLKFEVLTAEVKCIKKENKNLLSELVDLKRKVFERLPK